MTDTNQKQLTEKDPVFTPEVTAPVSTEAPDLKFQKSVSQVTPTPYFRTSEFTNLKPMAKIKQFGSMIGGIAQKYQTDPNEIKALTLTESDGNPYAQSEAGAKGLGQLTAITVKQIKKIMGDKFPENFDPYKPEHAIEGATVYWNWIKRHPGVKKAVAAYDGDPRDIYLAAYNAGPGIVSKNNGLPGGYEETDIHRKRFWDYFTKLGNKQGSFNMERLDVITDAMLSKHKVAIPVDMAPGGTINTETPLYRSKDTGGRGDIGGSGTMPPDQVINPGVGSPAPPSGGSGFGSTEGLGLPMMLAVALAGAVAHKGFGKAINWGKGVHPFRRMRKSLTQFKPLKEYNAAVASGVYKNNPKAQEKALAEVFEIAKKEKNYLTPEALGLIESQHNALKTINADPMSKFKDWLPKTPSQALFQIGGLGLAAKAPDVIGNIFGGDRRKGLTIS